MIARALNPEQHPAWPRGLRYTVTCNGVCDPSVHEALKASRALWDAFTTPAGVQSFDGLPEFEMGNCTLCHPRPSTLCWARCAECHAEPSTETSDLCASCEAKADEADAERRAERNGDDDRDALAADERWGETDYKRGA